VLDVRTVSGLGTSRSSTPPARKSTASPVSQTAITLNKATRVGLLAGTLLARSGLTPQSTRELRLSDGTIAGQFILSGNLSRGALPKHFSRIDETTRPEPYFGWTRATEKLTRRPGTAVVEQSGRILTAFTQGHGRFFRVMTANGRSALLQILRLLQAQP
jgi:hypothetical protein